MLSDYQSNVNHCPRSRLTINPTLAAFGLISRAYWRNSANPMNGAYLCGGLFWCQCFCYFWLLNFPGRSTFAARSLFIALG